MVMVMHLSFIGSLLYVPGSVLSKHFRCIVFESSQQFFKVDGVILIFKMRKFIEVSRLPRVTQQECSRASPEPRSCRRRACTQPPA